MNKFTQQIADGAENYSAAINTFAKLANNSLENVQKITALQYKIASSFIERSSIATKDLFGATTPAQASGVLKDFATASLESTLAASKEIFDVLCKSQTAFKDVATSAAKKAAQ